MNELAAHSRLSSCSLHIPSSLRSKACTCGHICATIVLDFNHRVYSMKLYMLRDSSIYKIGQLQVNSRNQIISKEKRVGSE